MSKRNQVINRLIQSSHFIKTRNAAERRHLTALLADAYDAGKAHGIAADPYAEYGRYMAEILADSSDDDFAAHGTIRAEQLGLTR